MQYVRSYESRDVPPQDNATELRPQVLGRELIYTYRTSWLRGRIKFSLQPVDDCKQLVYNRNHAKTKTVQIRGKQPDTKVSWQGTGPDVPLA